MKIFLERFFTVDGMQLYINFLAGLFCIIISLLGFFGIEFFNKEDIPSKYIFLILFFLPISSLAIYSRLEKIRHSMSSNIKYYDDSTKVELLLNDICSSAKEYIFSIGCRTRHTLLSEIEKKAKNGICYQRFIPDINNMTDDLKIHINTLIGKEKCSFKTKHMPNCPNFIVTEKHVMLILPCMHSGISRGIFITAPKAIDYYTRYFEQIFNDKTTQDIKEITPLTIKDQATHL